MLAPAVDLALVLDVPPALPVVPDRGEETCFRVEGERPELEVNGLAGLPVVHAVEGDAAVGGPVVLPVADDLVMCLERLARVPMTARKLKLGNNRVGLDVDAKGGRELCLGELRGGDVQERVAGAVEAVELLLRHTPASAIE